MALTFGRSAAAKLLDMTVEEFDRLVREGKLPNHRGSHRLPFWLLIDLKPFISNRRARLPSTAEAR